MTQEHPITPPPEHLKLWEDQHFDEGENYDVMLIQAYQVGADAELEACCKWVAEATPWAAENWVAEKLRKHRRPKPPSLKAQALEALDRMDQLPTAEDQSIIRRALENLPD